ncbi:Lrp/AsnC family transcriptional regulator [Streptomyces sp. NPDC048172]|uniref:Lrp/AsnC family transcriptional regulator n=1 Tax=Streptomyces sp. NPDC048172 TaxID=3365505 RepID=UPI003715BE41
MPKDLDPVDREIVRLVSAQGRISHEEIARRVHVSRPAVHERVKQWAAGEGAGRVACPLPGDPLPFAATWGA